jgi:hypothetical protein
MFILAMYCVVISTTKAETKGGLEVHVIVHARANVEVGEDRCGWILVVRLKPFPWLPVALSGDYLTSSNDRLCG